MGRFMHVLVHFSALLDQNFCSAKMMVKHRTLNKTLEVVPFLKDENVLILFEIVSVRSSLLISLLIKNKNKHLVS